MKKSFYVLFTVAVLALSYGFFKVSQADPNADQSPALNSEQGTLQDTIPPAGFPYPTLFNYNYASVPDMNGGTVGAMVLFNRFYFNRWNLTNTYVYNNSGPNGGPGTQVANYTYIGACRDLTTDGRYLYAGNATTTLYKFDTNMTLIWTRVLTGGSTRALCWDRNRVGFWNTNFAGNIFLHDTNGTLRGQITSALAAKYGMGWDSTSSPDSTFLWVWNQGTGTNQLQKIYISGFATGIIKADYTFTLLGGLGIAGGAEVVVYNNNLVLLLNYQNYALVGHRLKDLLVAIEPTQIQVRDFKLGQNYPNPFNPKTKITFSLAKAEDVSLEVFDMKGSKVATVINSWMQAGEHELMFDASNLSSGAYFYKISSNGYSETKKMLLVK